MQARPRLHAAVAEEHVLLPYHNYVYIILYHIMSYYYCVCTYIYIHTYTCVCIYIYIYIYIHIHAHVLCYIMLHHPCARAALRTAAGPRSSPRSSAPCFFATLMTFVFTMITNSPQNGRTSNQVFMIIMLL